MTTFLFSGMRQDDLDRPLAWHMNNDEGKGNFHVILDGVGYANAVRIADAIAAPAGVHLVSYQEIDEAPDSCKGKLLTYKQARARVPALRSAWEG